MTEFKHIHFTDFKNSKIYIILVGRLAEYKYYDMDDTVKRALEVFESII
ncbi:MAG: hypothetical protein QXH07_06435 [Thermoplasmata archaeon]